MSLLLPSTPATAHGPVGPSDGHHARHESSDGDFAAALAETAGETGEDAKTPKARTGEADDAARLLRVARRLAARETQGHDESPAPGTETGKGAARVKGARGAGQASAGKEVEPAVEKAPEVNRAELAPPATAVREALAALGVEMATRPERMAEGSAFGAALRLVAAGPRGLDTATQGMGGAGAPDLGDETDVEIVPVRVVQQERHFKPVGVEMQRWQGAQRAMEGERAAPLASSDPMAAQPEATRRDRPAVTAALAPPVEVAVAAPGVQPAPEAGEIMPGAVGAQIADRVQQALGTPSESGAHTPAQPPGVSHDPEARQVFAPAIRTLKLQLNPASLGMVTIVLSGNDGGLRIELAAELPDTVSKVESDRGVLAARLNGAGYAVSELSVARLGAQAMEGDTRDQGARQSHGQEPFAGSGAREGGGQGQHGDQHAGRAASPRASHTEQGAGASQGVAAAPAGGGVSYAGRFRSV